MCVESVDKRQASSSCLLDLPATQSDHSNSTHGSTQDTGDDLLTTASSAADAGNRHSEQLPRHDAPTSLAENYTDPLLRYNVDPHRDPLSRKRSDPPVRNGKDDGVLLPEPTETQVPASDTGALMSFDGVEPGEAAVAPSPNHSVETIDSSESQLVSEAVDRDLLSHSESAPTATSMNHLVSEADADLISQLDDVLASYIDGSSAAV